MAFTTKVCDIENEIVAKWLKITLHKKANYEELEGIFSNKAWSLVLKEQVKATSERDEDE